MIKINALFFYLKNTKTKLKLTGSFLVTCFFAGRIKCEYLNKNKILSYWENVRNVNISNELFRFEIYSLITAMM